jgi:hypothetical protein
MKKLLLLASAAVVSFGLSSCCCMFGGLAKTQYRTETVRACGHDTVSREVRVGDSKSGLTQTVTTRVPRYKKEKHAVYCHNCTHYYCPDKACCGANGEGLYRIASAQGSVGSPNLGLIPTMKQLAP